MSRMRAALSTRALDLLFGKFAQLEAERHVLGDGHVRIKRVVLEHHGDVAVLRRQVVDDLAADRYFATGDFLKPRDHPQRRAFAAAGGADEDHEFLVRDVEVDIAHRDDVVVALHYIP